MKPDSVKRRRSSAFIGWCITLVCGTSCALRAPSSGPTTAKAGATSATDAPVYAVMASFPEELAAIETAMVPDAAAIRKSQINGVELHAVDIAGKHYLFFLTGMSLVNAAMNTQMVLDHFAVKGVFFSGIAGGIDPAFHPATSSFRSAGITIPRPLILMNANRASMRWRTILNSGTKTSG